MLLTLLAAAAIGYQAIAIVACVRAWRSAKQRPGASGQGPVSVLKPIRGLDPALREAIQSHTVLRGDHEFLCGVSDPQDAALRVLREFPQLRIVSASTPAANGKVGTLIDLQAASRHPVLVVNDSDIRVQPDYLERVTAPLADPKVGLVTCLYRPIGDTSAARFEGLGVATDFVPSTLVARLMGVDEFAMGSTLAFRRRDLERIGGFAAIADYLADDYQLGHRIHALGLRCVLSDVIVDTHMGGNWAHVWAHQLRWARTIKAVNLGGYLGLPVTNASLWAVAAGVSGRWQLAVALLLVRFAMAWTSGWLVIRSRDALRLLWLVPVRDAYAFAVWLTGLAGRTVVWRGLRLRLDGDGKIMSESNRMLE